MLVAFIFTRVLLEEPEWNSLATALDRHCAQQLCHTAFYPDHPCGHFASWTKHTDPIQGCDALSYKALMNGTENEPLGLTG